MRIEIEMAGDVDLNNFQIFLVKLDAVLLLEEFRPLIKDIRVKQ